MITLNQKTSLLETLNVTIGDIFILSGNEEVYDYHWNVVLPSITEKQYKFLLALSYQNDKDKLYDVMTQMGFQRQPNHVK